MKMTKAARRELEAVLRNAVRAREYVMAEGTAVCRRRTMATTTLDYTRADGSVLCEVQRAYGSDLCGLDTAIQRLEGFLTMH